MFKELAGEGTLGLFVHSISGASLGRFLPTRGDAFSPRQVEKTFDYLAHSFAYWAQALYELDLLAPGARLVGLTNVLHDSLLNNTGLVAAAKAALQMYVRHLAIELGKPGRRRGAWNGRRVRFATADCNQCDVQRHDATDR